MSKELATRDASRAEIVLLPADKPGGEQTRAIARTTPNGAVRAVHCSIVLRKSADELYTMSKWNPTTGQSERRQLITALGYDKMNRIAGVSFIAPDTLIGDDGAERPNPHFHRNAHGETEYIRIRQIGIGRNATGNLAAHDLTLVYDLKNYFRQDLFSKWTGKKKDAPKEWGMLYSPDTLAVEKGKLGNRMAYPMPTGLYLVVQLDHADVQSCLAEHINRQRFAERNAVTILRRNILKKFFGVTVSEGSVGVIGWIDTDRDFRELGEMAAKAKEGRVDIGDGEQMIIDTDTETVDDPAEVEGVLAGEGEDAPAPDDEGEPAAGVNPSPPACDQDAIDCQTIRADLRRIVSSMDQALLAKASRAAGLSDGKAGMAEIAHIDDPRRLEEIRSAFEDAKLRHVQDQRTPPEPPPPSGVTEKQNANHQRKLL